MSRDDPFDLDVDLAALARVAADAGYTEERIERLSRSADAGGRVDIAWLRRSLAEPTPLHVLFRLFHIGDAVPDATARSALGDALVTALLRARVLRVYGDDVSATVRLAAYAGLLLASDVRPSDGALPADHVLGVTPTAVTLARFTVRREAGAVLDLGTGCGVQALLAARHATHVVATDIAPRALAFARLNAHINGMEGIDWRCGEWFEPVGDELFDLVVSNPPFALSPESRYVYRDAGMRGDDVARHVVRGAAAHLAPGGFATILISWHHAGEEDWSSRPREWLDDLSCDALLLRAYSVSPLDYAALFLRQTELDDPAEYGRHLDAWVRYFDELGAQRLAIGKMVLRRRATGTPWFRADTIAMERVVGAAGTHLEHLFRNEDLLHDLASDRMLLDVVLRVNPAHVLEHRLQLEDGAWKPESSVLRLTAGITSAGGVDDHAALLLAGCDGRRPFRRAVEDVARASGLGFEAAVPTSVSLARRLLRSGVLQRADLG